MSYLRTYRTNCPSCGWEGDVGFGDVPLGPWRRTDGSLFYKELICPDCQEQVNNPTEDTPGEHPIISPEQEEAAKSWARLLNAHRRTNESQPPAE